MEVNIVKTPEEKAFAEQIRFTVFVDEQNVPAALEIDAYEEEAIHFVGYENGQAIAASRIRFVDDYGKLERICILKAHRGKQYGKQIIQAMEQEIKRQGYEKAKLNGQTYAEGFYNKLGYKTTSEAFMDAGIPHVEMIKTL